MSLHEVLSRIYHISLREVGIMRRNPIYGFCTVVFPILVIIFFTSLMAGGQPTDMPYRHRGSGQHHYHARDGATTQRFPVVEGRRLLS